MKIFFAGTEPKKIYDFLIKLGVKNMLGSAYTMGYKKFSYDIDKLDNFLLDSGGYTIRLKKLPFDIQNYVDYINRHGIKLAFNLDTNNLEESLKNQEILEKKTRAKILPVYHVSDYVSPKDKKILDYYIEKYDYISIGGMAGVAHSHALLENFLSYVFSKTKDKVKVHGLGITNKKLLQKYPFYSVDSTSWQAPMRYGVSKAEKNKKLQYYNKKTKHYLENTIAEVKYYLELENYITKLWAKRGIIWKD